MRRAFLLLSRLPVVFCLDVVTTTRADRVMERLDRGPTRR